MSDLSHYEISVKIDPETQALSADVRLRYIPRPGAATPRFLLHRSLKIDQFEVDGVQGCDLEAGCSFPFTPEAATIRLPADARHLPDHPLDIRATYHGRIGIVSEWETNRITRDWIELGMYCPWFPWDPDEPGFTYRVAVDVPPAYTVTGLGTTTRDGDRWIITSEKPKQDIVIIAAPELLNRTVTHGDLTVAVHFTRPDDAPAALDLAEQGAWVMGYMSDWLDDRSPRRADLVVANRDKGGGYARPGLVVLGSIGDYTRRERMFRYIAHEFAHLWWIGAPTDGWQDWLNEAFAEYSSMRAARAHLGEEPYAQDVERKRAKVAGLPPIRGIDRTSEQAYDVLYNKGALVLCDLESAIGDAAFTELLRRFAREPVKDNDSLLKLLTDVAGSRAAEQLNCWLDR